MSMHGVKGHNSPLQKKAAPVKKKVAKKKATKKD